ncbi:MAG: roadblock/LC7 domain-containing protein [archaeon]|nr:roadblock/LC7 domain-containing protein [archaeon]
MTSDIEAKLAQLMSDIAEIEGIVAFDAGGKVISGQTIEEKDKNKIAKTASSLIGNLKPFGESIGKGNVNEVTLNMDEGYAVILFGEKHSIAAFVGKDDKNQLALLSRSIRNLLK